MLAILIIVAVVVLIGIYLLVTRKPTGGSGGPRPDETERPELTGSEQYKHREIKRP